MSTSENVEEGCSSITHISGGVKKKFWQWVRVALPSLLIIGVWSALSMPIVFYHLPISEISSNSSDTNDSVSDSMCSEPVQYATTSGICLTEFNNILTSINCPLDHEGGVLVKRNEEILALQVINGLTTIGASADCINKAFPFFCLILFGLCGGSGFSIQPTSSQCEKIRDSQCQQHWIFVQRLGIDLPDCSVFPAEPFSCPALNDSLSTSVTLTTNMSDKRINNIHTMSLTRVTWLYSVENHPNGMIGTVLECSEGFYQESESTICIPNCYTWMQGTEELSISKVVLIFMSTFLGFLAAIAVILISCLGHKRMFVFPAIFIVYMTIDSLALFVLVMVGSVNYNTLFCSSRSLIEAWMQVTPFCVMSGIVSTYIFCQIPLWWIFHLSTLFWQVVFPFHAQNLETTGKNKYIHIICVTLGILLPLVPIITIMADFAVDLQKQNNVNSTSQVRNKLFLSGGLGFQPRRYPSVVCIGSDSDTIFYSIFLTVHIIVAVGCSLLIIIFCSVHKAHIKRIRMQQDVNTEFTFGKAEKKLFIVICYFVVFAVIYPIPFNLSSRNYAQFLDNLLKYFSCEEGGHNPSNPCTYSEVESIDLKIFSVISIILQSLYPAMNLLYTVNIQELKKLWSRVHGPCRSQ